MKSDGNQTKILQMKSDGNQTKVLNLKVLKLRMWNVLFLYKITLNNNFLI